MQLPSVLTVAGSDSSGGAGIQADLKTIAALGLYGQSVICALTAQNTCGVRSIQETDAQIVADQMDAVFEDIRPASVKIGMLSSARVARTVAQGLRRGGGAPCGNRHIDLVASPDFHHFIVLTGPEGHLQPVRHLRRG